MAIDLTILKNTSFALLVWYIQEGKDREAKVYKGEATWDPARKVVEVRRKDSDRLMATLNNDQLDRILKVTDDVREILLDCDYGIALSISDLPDDNVDGYEQLDMKW